MEQIQEYLAKFRDGLPELFDKVIADCDARIHSELEDEYDIPESPYVESHPIVQLKPEIYDLESGLEFSDYKENVLHEFSKKYEEKTKQLFQYNKILPQDEKVIKVLIKVNYKIVEYGSSFCMNRILGLTDIKIIHITNKGRILILSNGVNYNTRSYGNGNVYITGCLQKSQEYIVQNKQLCYKHNQQPIPNSTLPSLTHKFPKLFLNVINALRAESTDDMQKCCEYYYSRIHAKDKLEKENKKLRAECDSLKTKNKQLENENKELRAKIQVLEVDGAREKLQEKDQYIQELLMEIELLKIKNMEERRLYMG